MQENIVQLTHWNKLFSCSVDVQSEVELEDEESYEYNTRVYYNSFWIHRDHAQRFINNVCVTHSRRDVHMTTLIDPKDLLDMKERLRARKHVLCMRSKIYALGGCGPFPRMILPEEERREALILFFPTIDWDLQGLDAETFFILHHNHERIKKIRDKSMLLSLGNGYFFDENAYACAVAEDVLLLLMAAEEEQLRQHREKKLWIKLPPLGYGPGVFSWNGIHIGPLLVRSFFWGVLFALNAFEWTRIGVIELVDITRNFSLTPNWPSEINNVKIVCGQRRDILDFSRETAVHIEDDICEFDASVVCPGDAFAWPGNELHDSCLNSMIANNTSIRRMGSPHYNQSLCRTEVYVPVRVPIKQLSYNHSWWPPKEFHDV